MKNPPPEGETKTGVESVTVRTVTGRRDARTTPEKTTSTDASIKQNKIHTLQAAVGRA
jgi:hypothetical protein